MVDLTSKANSPLKKKKPVKNRVLLFCSRGLNARITHLLRDLHNLLPHTKRESKFDSKTPLSAINEVCQLQNINHVFFFEHKRACTFVWISRCPSGPSIRFILQNVMTMGELKLSGNCLKGSRPLLRFDDSFETVEHLKLIKELLIHIFGIPNGHKESKPFFDHIFSFSYIDERIWFRNYQIVPDPENKLPFLLIEIGPRFVLKPERIFSGSFFGGTIWRNSKLSIKKEEEISKDYINRKRNKFKTQKNKDEAILPKTELDDLFD